MPSGGNSQFVYYAESRYVQGFAAFRGAAECGKTVTNLLRE
jgi:hypothetical protein